MKRLWLAFCARTDALTLRERVLSFCAVAAAIVFVAWMVVLGPMFAKHAALRAQIGQALNNAAGIDTEIAQKLQAYEADPDAEARERIASVRDETARLAESLRAMQKGLVPAERMAPLLDTILRANGRLQLASMKTLAVAPLTGLVEQGKDAPAAAPAPAPAGAAQPAGLLYRHGVEVAVRGNYLDLLNYMDALEAMPTQLFWGKAELEVEQYPVSRLTLTLYTLSLDPTWMKL